MKFLNKFKPELAASTDSSRFVLENVMVDIWDNHPVLVGTDGRMIAVVPCQVDSIHEVGMVSKQALAAARKACRLKTTKEYPVEIELNGAAVVRDGEATHTFKRLTEANFPKWTALPQLKEQPKKPFTVSFDPTMLLRLAKAIGSDKGVTLEVTEMDDAWHTACIKVRPYGKDEGAFGILMPLRKEAA